MVSKVSTKEVEFDEEAEDGEEWFLFNSDDKTVAYYSNKNVKKFFKKLFNEKFKNSYDSKGVSTSGKGVKEDMKAEKKVIESLNEKKKE